MRAETVTGPPLTRPRPRARHVVRLEIQVLRAAAVTIVVLYHFWPHRLPGGFVGVDVFFAISGFLITAHLLTSQNSATGVSLLAFWARRARRLLPASLLVLGVTAVVTIVALPQTVWQQTLREITGSALYVQNWVLAADAVDYLAAENAASPVQHFWSLSVEEQFYLVWPLLFVAASLLATKARGRATARKLTLVLVVGVFVTSLAWSIHLTGVSPGTAYFVTTTRAWEFAAGGLLAFLGTAVRTAPSLRSTASWAGWLGLVTSCFVIDGTTPFPGIAAALPVLSSLIVIWAGTPDVAWAPHRFLARGPVLFVGDTSYSIYLWHWPVLTVVSALLGEDFTWWIKLAFLSNIVFLAWLTYRYVENPLRSAPALRSPRETRTFIAMATAITLVVVPTLVTASALEAAAQSEVRAAQAAAEQETACFGAAALDPAQNCSASKPSGLVPTPAAAVDDKADAYTNGCIATNTGSELKTCSFGDGSKRIALVGDSHMVSWEPAFQQLAEERDWTVQTFFKSACPHSASPTLQGGAEIMASCRSWNADVDTAVAAAEPFDVVVVTHSVTAAQYASPAEEMSGYRQAWAQFTDRGAKLVVIRDVPRVPEDTNVCLAADASDPLACSLPREESLVGPDRMVEAAEGLPEATIVDMTDYLCDSSWCPAAIGGVVVFRDTHHLTKTFATTLSPYLGEALRGVA